MAEFSKYSPMYDLARSAGMKFKNVDEFYGSPLHLNVHMNNGGRLQVQFEWKWLETRRPYYLLYPAALAAFQRLTLEKIDCAAIQPPSDQTALIVYLPKGNKLLDGDREATALYILTDVVHSDNIPLVAFGVYYGEYGLVSGLKVPSWDYWFFERIQGRSISEEIERVLKCTQPLPIDVKIYGSSESRLLTTEELKRLTRVGATLCLLNNSPDFLRPDILAADETRCKTPADILKYQQRAHKRGKIGWTIGRDMENQPHTRIPHPAFYWCGPGRTRLEVRYRPGVIVHREVLEAIPTGFEEDPKTPRNVLGAED